MNGSIKYTSGGRRDFLYKAGATGLGLSTIISRPVVADTIPGGDSWPKRHWRTYTDNNYDGQGTDCITSIATNFNFLGAVYNAGRWKHDYRLQTGAGSVFRLSDGRITPSYALGGKQVLKVREVLNEPDLDSYHGTEEWNLTVTGGSLNNIPWWVKDGFEFIAGQFSNPVGILFDAAEFYGHMKDANSPSSSSGIYKTWNLAGMGKCGHNIRWTTEYLPKEQTGNEDHAIRVISRITRVPGANGNLVRYNTDWRVTLGSMYSPNNMTAQEKKEYQVSKVPARQSTLSSSTISKIGGNKPVWIAKNPPIKAELM